MTGCHPIKGMVKLPKGFVSKIFDSENGQLKIQAYVTTATPQDSKCSSDPPGVHIFRGVRLDLMTKIFIPAAEVRTTNIEETDCL